MALAETQTPLETVPYPNPLEDYPADDAALLVYEGTGLAVATYQNFIKEHVKQPWSTGRNVFYGTSLLHMGDDGIVGYDLKSSVPTYWREEDNSPRLNIFTGKRDNKITIIPNGNPRGRSLLVLPKKEGDNTMLIVPHSMPQILYSIEELTERIEQMRQYPESVPALAGRLSLVS